ncbi:hypothetical protein KC340_g11580 [Hortaea werneckii]|nr:hypothetical protein KC342_g9125 [Hortaea werneckii]KAI7092273.1 hypothetical protein KC339_g12462 [Hortaea werneckii]KAI7231260.1 hypothetical protein KC365_g7280 [Hortaea werneckii]KAI7306893.1 hypothetical protein KC340_g11580 [Hortaea werneckii]KAI7390464.1 hypothetical protein KC328_g7927 [Hortaea werneckii]
MALIKTKASAADLEKLRWCRQLSLVIKAEEALNAFLVKTDTNELHISVNLADAANVACKIGTQAAVEANIRSAYWLVTANEAVRTAKIYAKKYNLQTIAEWMRDKEG